MYNLIKNGDLAGVQRAVQNDPALLNATVTLAQHTPLMWALHKNSGGHPAIAQWLVEQKANLDLQTNNGLTALMLGCGDQPDTAQLLIERGAKLDLQNNTGWTALMWACRYDQPDTVHSLIEHGAELDMQQKIGYTALTLACQQPEEPHHTEAGLLRCLKLCYAAGAALDMQTKKGRDALALAKYRKREDAVAFLEFATMLEVARGLQGKLQQPRSVFVASLQTQNTKNGDKDLETNLDRAQAMHKESQTPLMQACKNGDVSKAKELVADAAQIYAQDSLGLTPMIYACGADDEEASLVLAKLLFEHSAGLSSESPGIMEALALASWKDRMDLTTFLSFIQSLPLAHFATKALRVTVIKLFNQGVRTLEEAHKLTSARLEQVGISSAQDRFDFLQAVADPEQTSKVDALAAKVSLARTERGEGKVTLHPRLHEIFTEQLLRKDPVASLADFDTQQATLHEKEQELTALQEAVKTDVNKISQRNEARCDLVAGIRDALSSGVEGQLEKIETDPEIKSVLDAYHSLWEDILKEPVDIDDVHVPVTFEQVQEATQAAIEVVKAWEHRHDTSIAREHTETAIDALDESTARLGIQSTFFMALRHPERARVLVTELHNVQQALEAELDTLTNVDPMADAPLEDVRRALASTISFYTRTVQNEVSRLQTAVTDLSAPLSRHVPGVSTPDRSRVTEMIRKNRQNKRKREDLELHLQCTREDAMDGDAEAQARIPGLEQELAQIESAYKLDSELRRERARVLRHAEEHYPELRGDQ